MKNNLLKIKIFWIASLTTVLLFSNIPGSRATQSATSNSATWNFSSASDFTISDASKLKFSSGSAKIIPTGFQKDWAKKWHDTHFAPNPGDGYAYAVATDSSDNIFFGGYTNNGAGGQNYGFIVKADPDLNEIWYKANYFPGAIYSEIYRMVFASDGNILVHGGYIDSSNNCHSVLMKIKPVDGSVIWSTTINQPVGVVGIDGYDRAAGPVVDSSGNIYIAVANHPDFGSDAEPTGIHKFDSNGNLIWSRSDALLSYQSPSYWEDLWDMVIDSEGSIYLSITVNGAANLKWGILKYDTNGNRVWVNTKDWVIDMFAAPRGISIDADDYIYQNGNAGDDPAKGAGCGIRKLDKNGNVIQASIIAAASIPGDFIYCWSSTVDIFGNWYLAANAELNGNFTLARSNTSVLGLKDYYQYFFPERSSHAVNLPKAFLDKYQNAYYLGGFSDSANSNKMSIAIMKSSNIYPNTTSGSGTPLTLINKTPVSYNTLSGFSVSYGPMDQADVRFQISNDGAKWYFWNGSSWVLTSGNDANTEAEVNANISKFSDQFGPGLFYFKSFMITDGTKEVDLASVTVSKDQPLAVLPLAVLPKTGKNTVGIESIISYILVFGLILLNARRKSIPS